jgi:hypothetical protein
MAAGAIKWRAGRPADQRRQPHDIAVQRSREPVVAVARGRWFAIGEEYFYYKHEFVTIVLVL